MAKRFCFILLLFVALSAVARAAPKGVLVTEPATLLAVASSVAGGLALGGREGPMPLDHPGEGTVAQDAGDLGYDPPNLHTLMLDAPVTPPTRFTFEAPDAEALIALAFLPPRRYAAALSDDPTQAAAESVASGTLANAATPEPQAWMLALAGIACVAVLITRRRAR